MQILDNLIIITLHVLCFIAGMKLSDRYHRDAEISRKEALERQFVRLRTKSDADDPCRPYIAPQVCHPVPDSDSKVNPIPPEFMRELKDNGKAKTAFRKSDLTK